MRTPFDDVMVAIQDRGYHNHRKQEHSDLVCEGVFRDLLSICKPLSEDYESGEVGYWLNVGAPGGRGRKLDLVIGEPNPDTGGSAFERLRIGLENKSVITAHRNKSSRFDDLSETLDAILRVRPEAVMAATVMVGTASRVLNIPDRVKQIAKREGLDFKKDILPRLSSGDSSLWREFSHAISQNRDDDASKTLALFRNLKMRKPAHTHVHGYDYVLAVPVFVDNVGTPYVDRQNKLSIDVDAHYSGMLDSLCRAYKARWHS